MFWFYSGTGSEVIGPLHASLIYDIPVFLSYLSLIPGMAVFLVRMETDFVEYYSNFYDAVREGGSLSYIEEMRNQMVFVIRQGIFPAAALATRLLACLIGSSAVIAQQPHDYCMAGLGALPLLLWLGCFLAGYSFGELLI